MVLIIFAIIFSYIVLNVINKYRQKQRFNNLEKRRKIEYDNKRKELENSSEYKDLLLLSKKRKYNSQEFFRLLKDNNIICFYHFTDKRNLNTIREKGGLFSWKYLKDGTNIQKYTKF